MTRATTAVFAATAALALAACVPALPGGALGDGTGGATGDSTGAGGMAGITSGSGAAATGGPTEPTGGAGGAAGTATGGAQAGGAGGTPALEFLFVPAVGRPPNLAVNSTYLFWADTDRRALMKIRVDGVGGPMSVAPLVSPNTWVAADAQNVYWTGSSPGALSIFRVGNDGGAPTMLASHTTTPSGLAVNGSGVYWITTAGAVMKVSLDGGTPLLLAQTGFAIVLVVDDENVYWVGDCDQETACQSINKVGTSGGAPVEIVRWQGMITSLAVDSMTLYWADAISNTLFMVSADGGTPQPVLPASGASSLAVDASGIYWTDQKGSLLAAMHGSTTQRVISKGTGVPAFGATLDAQNVYWFAAAPPPGAIMKAPK